ncbi:rhodanese-like domain-containing protein [Solibacillus daqui]|uniref:rhodanese-like domain-containing protein n=1 Tax=Solibacillus daqui TaxID=2912187 RepID=UPI002365BD94|nr:rhodanese-like domain-containing protein [Solibacillus daqui]
MIESIILLAICAAVVIWKKRPVEGVNTISTDELQTMLRDDDKIFIDVRSARDFNKMHVAPFINDPNGLGIEALPMDKEIVVMCRSGMRSLETCKKLKKLGVKKVTNVRGGISAYNERGLDDK